MAGTILITGANGSLAVPVIKRFLAEVPESTLLLTVRNASSADSNTENLRHLISQFPESRTSIRELDLADLTAVQSFATSVAADISTGKLPALSSILCNAYFWNLNGATELTKDGFEKTFQVNHIAHAALTLRLLRSFAPAGGRIVLFSSDAHFPGKNSLQKYPPAIPSDMELLAKPAADDPVDNFGRGFLRYANSKLAVTMWMYVLNRYLEKANSNLSKITAVAINPGNLSDSRALRTNTPSMLYYMSKFVIQPLRPLLRLTDPTLRTANKAAADVAELATSKAYPGQRGYFTLSKKDDSSLDSMDEGKQQVLWDKTMEWANITRDEIGI
ncbi:hypothetical protein MMC11_008806 [Xylographa trunciseda]|nr:hypothetical protein [Xylographa trunciseda]